MVMRDAHRLKGAASPLLRGMASICALSVMCGLFAPAPAAPPDDQIIAIFDEQPVEFDKALADGTQRDNLVRLYRNGQQIERTISLPALPSNMRDAQRIV